LKGDSLFDAIDAELAIDAFIPVQVKTFSSAAERAAYADWVVAEISGIDLDGPNAQRADNLLDTLDHELCDLVLDRLDELEEEDPEVPSEESEPEEEEARAGSAQAYLASKSKAPKKEVDVNDLYSQIATVAIQAGGGKRDVEGHYQYRIKVRVRGHTVKENGPYPDVMRRYSDFVELYGILSVIPVFQNRIVHLPPMPRKHMLTSSSDPGVISERETGLGKVLQGIMKSNEARNNPATRDFLNPKLNYL